MNLKGFEKQWFVRGTVKKKIGKVCKNVNVIIQIKYIKENKATDTSQTIKVT